MPSPQGGLLIRGDEALGDTSALLEVLQKLGRHIEALELAVMSTPERVAELIEEAGPAYLRARATRAAASAFGRP